MENEHVRILREGVTRWNAWRDSNPGTKPDLRKADLREQVLGGSYLIAADLSSADLRGTVLLGANLLGADLHGADLRGADLGFANLQAANLVGADLRGAILAEGNLRGADLGGVNLGNADLTEANLRGADLRGASLADATLRDADLSYGDLSGADLSAALLWRTNLSHAVLHQATLTDTVFGETILAHTRLTGVKGIESCVHFLPSSIDHQTILLSGTLPPDFLIACGMPKRLMEYLPSLLDDPIQKHACFISYAGKDGEFAARLRSDLQDHGARCWLAPKGDKMGGPLGVRIDEAIRVSDKLLVVMSATSLAGDWIEDEIEAAFDKEESTGTTVLFPIRIDDAFTASDQAWASGLRDSHNIADFSKWQDPSSYQESLDRLLRDLRA